MRNAFITYSTLVALVSATASTISFAAANNFIGTRTSQDDAYLSQTAQEIIKTLDAGVADFGSDDRANLALLNAIADGEVNSYQQKHPNSPAPDEHYAAEDSLAAHFSSEFKQPDDISDANYKAQYPFENTRDLYTFCPAGGQVERPITESESVVPTDMVYDWSWSLCTEGTAIRVQQIWISNVKQGHPTLTLYIVEDGWAPGSPGKSLKINLDLNELMAGKISASDILKYLK